MAQAEDAPKNPLAEASNLKHQYRSLHCGPLQSSRGVCLLARVWEAVPILIGDLPNDLAPKLLDTGEHRSSSRKRLGACPCPCPSPLNGVGGVPLHSRMPPPQNNAAFVFRRRFGGDAPSPPPLLPTPPPLLPPSSTKNRWGCPLPTEDPGDRLPLNTWQTRTEKPR